MTFDDYKNAYLSGLAPPSTPLSKTTETTSSATSADSTLTPVALSPSHYYESVNHTKPQPTLTELFDAGIHCGHAEAKKALGARLPYVQADLDSTTGIVAQYKNHVAHLQEELADSRRTLQAFSLAHEKVVSNLDTEVLRTRAHVVHYQGEVDKLLSSTSWKITSPLRAVSNRTRALVRQVKHTKPNMALQRARVNNALLVLRNEGFGALTKRVIQKLKRGKGRPADITAHYQISEYIQPLNIPTSNTPLVTILIPCYEQALHTYTCLKSIAEHASESISFEVIIADDCSPTPLEQSLAGVTGVRFIRHDTNLRFLRNVNTAAKHARGQYLLLLNNDTMVTAGWLDALLDTYQKFDRVGAVGAKLIYPDGVLQEAGGIVWQDGSAWNYGRNDDAGKPEYNYVREVDYCSAACLILETKLWNELGGFDDQFAPAYCEDSDLCQAIANKGLRVLYQPHSTIVHFEGVSHGTDTASGLKAYQVENQAKLKAKWQHRWQMHRSNGMAPELERDRNVTKRLLYIDATMLRPDQDSGSVRSARILKLARKMNWRVTFVPDNLEFDEPYTKDLQAHGIETLYWPQCAGVQNFLDAHAHEYDLIILSRYYVAAKHIETVRERAPRTRLALDTHDLHFVRARRLAALEDSSGLEKDAARVYAEEMSVLAACDEILVVSPVEKELLAEHLPSKSVTVLTNIHDVAKHVPNFSKRNGLMFVGGYRHPPNVDAVLWYAKEIHPLVQAKRPGLIAHIVGSNPPDVFKQFASETFILEGFIEDMTPLLEQCRLSIAPLRYGAGVKGKINQSMAHGLPVVGTGPAVEGMYLKNGEEVLVADTPEAFADAIIRLHDNQQIWNALSQASVKNVIDYFSEAVAERELEGMMKRAFEHAGTVIK